MSELPITVTRRRVAGNSHDNETNFSSSPEETKEHNPYTSPFSSFSNLSTSLWNSARHTLTPVSSAPSFAYAYNTLPSNDSSSSLNSLVNSPPPAAFFEMPQRDRTAEFRTTAKSYQMKIQANGRISQNEHPNHLVQQSVQFNQLAKRIGRDLSHTCAKMEKLTELAKKRSLFDDRMVEVEELSQIIKQVISLI
ncbi:unnamed protein product [Anisakis simplex]|uniref:Putative syntaxin-5 (inferred by orthology to a C. elegans protein) n=1 Tax=Anisakis simplex TaxID=6269 RepID=A0A0M3J9B7_ANISI|nr:unnamed protein product [Anisakis simplex]